MNLNKPNILSAVLLLLIATACSFGSLMGATPEVIVVTSAPVEAIAPTQSEDTSKPVIITPTTAAEVSLLPHTVNYLAPDSAGIDQVWALSVDGTTAQQITHATAAITDYDVSTTTGYIAYVSDNDLYLLPSASEAPLLITDGQPRDESNSLWYMKYGQANPHWSNDGSKLAFYQAGLSIFTPADGSIKQIRKNIVNEGDVLLTAEMYSPLSWSPDDSRLVLDITYSEGGSEALYTFADDSLVKLVKSDGGSPCCDAFWHADGSKIYIAGFSYMSASSDFWAFDGTTGAPTVVIPEMDAAGQFNLPLYPTVVGTDFMFFYTHFETELADDQLISLVKSPISDPLNMTTLRSDVPRVDHAIWAPDGSFVLGLKRLADSHESPYYGEILYIPAGNQPMQTLVTKAHSIKWGL